MKTPVSQNKKRPRQQEAVHNAPEEISQAQAQWQAEQLTPCLYLFYGYSDGHNQKMTTIDITGYKHRKFLHRSDLKPGKRLECCYVPGFARWAQKKALENMKEKPVQEIEESESDYRAFRTALVMRRFL